MNEADVKDLFAAAVANPGADRIDTDAVLRGGRRRRHVRTAATVGSVLLVLVVAGSVALTAGRQPGPRPAPVGSGAPSTLTAPTTLAVSCSPSGITVSGNAVAATGAGVVVSVSNTMPAGAYLNYEWPGGGGGDLLPGSPATWTLLAPPGRLTLSCTLNGDPRPGAERTVTVTDPSGYWRSTTLADLGCAQGGFLSWAGRPGSGATPEAAVSDLLPQLTRNGRALTATRAPVGYPDATTERWIASTADGRPYLVIAVAPDGSKYIAGPDMMCAP